MTSNCRTKTRTTGKDDRDEDLPSFDGLPVLIPDAGKIRFAEDIVEEYRGGSRSGRRRRGGGGGVLGGGAGGGFPWRRSGRWRRPLNHSRHSLP
ncbi:MAG: hypothetical protein CM1200mP22_17320 [Dehalococcoidia bacterium]|nr:MAG: hypothetical protein CM1200mP22_17320 [Dehalococcoidia bacterium]